MCTSSLPIDAPITVTTTKHQQQAEQLDKQQTESLTDLAEQIRSEIQAQGGKPDDKQAMQLELNELVSSLVKEKEMQSQMTSQLESQEAELLELEDIKNRLEP